MGDTLLEEGNNMDETAGCETRWHKSQRYKFVGGSQ
jgi:hypothetical protein